jgi:hypothetical protein
MPDFALPKAVTDLFPESVRDYALFIVGGAACFGALVVLLVLLSVFRFLFGRRTLPPAKGKSLEEDLDTYPDLKFASGDKQLRVEGVPVRLRFIVVAPAGTTSEFDLDELKDLLNKLVPGLGDVYKHDKPRVKVWPGQVSYQGFGVQFHKNMDTGAKEGEETRWVLIAGRAKVGKQQVMLGMALQSIKPNTVGRRTIDSHEWASVLRVRVKD